MARSIEHAEASFNKLSIEINSLAENAKSILVDLIDTVRELGVMPEQAFVYDNTLGKRHANVVEEHAVVLGTKVIKSTSYSNSYPVLLLADGSIVAISRYSRVYDNPTKLPHDHWSRKQTKSKILHIQYSGLNRQEIKGSEYLTHGLIAFKILKKLINARGEASADQS